MKSIISLPPKLAGLVGGALVTVILFSALGETPHPLVLAAGHGDNCYLIFEKQMDVLGSKGQSGAFVFIKELYHFMPPFYSQLCPVGSDRVLLSVNQKNLGRVNVKMSPEALEKREALYK